MFGIITYFNYHVSLGQVLHQYLFTELTNIDLKMEMRNINVRMRCLIARKDIDFDIFNPVTCLWPSRDTGGQWMIRLRH